MIKNHKYFPFADLYELNCPEGIWTARLDHTAWGETANLILYLTDTATGEQYWFSVFASTDYKPRDKGQDFRNDAEPGDFFELTTTKTKNGYPKLLSARKILRVVGEGLREENAPFEPVDPDEWGGTA